MSKSTPATLALVKSGVSFTLHSYDYDPGSERVGLQAAEALGEPPARVLKTLMAKVDGRPVCAILPSDRTVAMKKLATALGGRAAEMMTPAEAERLTGYRVGGVSPFGQKRQVPTVLERTALEQPFVFVNAGQRGLQTRLEPEEVRRAAGALIADILA